MYATNVETRLEFVGQSIDGSQRMISPTALAVRTTTNTRGFLGGADQFHPGPHNPAFVNHLRDLGELACVVGRPGLFKVEVILTERPRHHATESRRAVQVVCVR